MTSDTSFSDVQNSTADVLIGALITIGIDPSDISMEISLTELDVSSLEIVEIIEIIREELDIELQGKDVLACVTLQDIADLVNREASVVAG
jgi:acyl carrier protein